MLRFVLLLLVLASCQDIKEIGGGAGLDLPFLGVVYECHTETGQTLELCWDSGADTLSQELQDRGYGRSLCGATPRHLGPCVYQCPPQTGCNAYQSCWCPEES